MTQSTDYVWNHFGTNSVPWRPKAPLGGLLPLGAAETPFTHLCGGVWALPAEPLSSVQASVRKWGRVAGLTEGVQRWGCFQLTPSFPSASATFIWKQPMKAGGP